MEKGHLPGGRETNAEIQNKGILHIIQESEFTQELIKPEMIIIK